MSTLTFTTEEVDVMIHLVAKIGTGGIVADSIKALIYKCKSAKDYDNIKVVQTDGCY